MTTTAVRIFKILLLWFTFSFTFPKSLCLTYDESLVLCAHRRAAQQALAARKSLEEWQGDGLSKGSEQYKVTLQRLLHEYDMRLDKFIDLVKYLGDESVEGQAGEDGS